MFVVSLNLNTKNPKIECSVCCSFNLNFNCFCRKGIKEDLKCKFESDNPSSSFTLSLWSSPIFYHVLPCHFFSPIFFNSIFNLSSFSPPYFFILNSIPIFHLSSILIQAQSKQNRITISHLKSVQIYSVTQISYTFKSKQRHPKILNSGRRKSESILHAITTGITLFHFSTAGTKPTRISYWNVNYQPYYKQLNYKKKHNFFSSNEIY